MLALAKSKCNYTWQTALLLYIMRWSVPRLPLYYPKWLTWSSVTHSMIRNSLHNESPTSQIAPWVGCNSMIRDSFTNAIDPWLIFQCDWSVAEFPIQWSMKHSAMRPPHLKASSGCESLMNHVSVWESYESRMCVRVLWITYVCESLMNDANEWRIIESYWPMNHVS